MANDDSTVKVKPLLQFILPILAAAAAAAPCFFSKAESLAAAIRGSSSGAGWIDRLTAACYSSAGLLGADLARAAAIAVPVLVGFFTLAWIATKLPTPFEKPFRLCLGITALLVTGFGIYASIEAWRNDIRDIRLLAPVGLLKEAEEAGRRVFLNSSALSAARLLAPALASQAPSETEIPVLTKSPVRWREAHREAPFTAILLATPLDDSRPLIEMLDATPEWHLARIDNQGLLYRRDAAEGPPQPARQVFSIKRETAIHDAQTAMVLHFLGKKSQARGLMENALQNAPSEPAVLIRSATLAAALSQWQSAKKDAAAALKSDASSVQARYLLALALLETGNIPGAARETETLSSQHSNDPSVLWLTARISREANDPTTEIAALEKLLVLAKNQKEPPTLIHIHLAQAWAKRGFAAQALENYQAALKGNLTPKQRKELENAIGTIQSRAPRP